MKYTEKKVSVPLCAVSTTPGLVNKTGSWKFAEPLFIDRVSPCNQQCPAGEDITGYMYLASQGRFEEAWKLITEENPFPAIMGRVCFHTCEEQCNRKDHDEAVCIHTVERFIGDYGLSHGLKIDVTEPEKDKKIAVVGAGPGGLSAAFHLRKRGYRVTTFDRDQKPGGLMWYGIPAYRLPKDILDAEINRLYEMGIEFKMGVTIGRDITWDALNTQFDAVFVALGAYEEAGLSIEGINKQGIFEALRFLREINLGKKPKYGKNMAVGSGQRRPSCIAEPKTRCQPTRKRLQWPGKRELNFSFLPPQKRYTARTGSQASNLKRWPWERWMILAGDDPLPPGRPLISIVTA
ncbi:MAG: FAD-dependent oxidoreductase [Deltaproteobacteria bacterium]|nr:FAD-dependent oxidoreductase [Deltaproteobacteria bacterium]